MSGVDNRVVAMQFDNAAFEAKMAETLKSLDKLKASLDFAAQQRSLGDLENTGKNFTMGGIGNAVEGVSGKFLALATVGITALSNITNKAVNAGEQLLKSFTVAPISQGFENFSNKMTSISTILANTASKGTKLNDVQDALGNLNTYANQTIYDFAQMTQNLGTFTAAGVDLKTSQESIKGIANVAAISGSNTEQASTAMYQLSQAMAAGQVHLQDWNSVVNAGMGGQVFQKALFDTGVALKQIPGVPVGTTFEDWTKKGNSFRESLQSGWLTTKVLTTTLNSFSGDFTAAQLKQMGYSADQAAAMVKLGQSGLQAATQIKSLHALMDMLKENTAAGWSDTFQILAGNYDQAVGLFTEIGNGLGGIVAKSAKARNDLLKGWADLGGRTALVQGFKNAIKALGEIFGTVKTIFREFFPATTSKQLADTTKAFEAFTKKLIPSQATLVKIGDIFRGVFSILDVGKEILKGIVIVIGNFLGGIRNMVSGGGSLLTFLSKAGLFLADLDEKFVLGGKIQDFFNKIGNAVRWPLDNFQKLIDVVKGFFGVVPASSGPTNKTLHDFGETVSRAKDTTDALENAFHRLGDRFGAIAGLFRTNSTAFKDLDRIFNSIKGALDKAGEAIRKWFSELGANIAAAIKPADFNTAVDAVNVGLLGGIIVLLKKFLGTIKEMDLSGGVLDSIKEALDGVKGQLKAMQTELKAKALEEIAIALGVLTASIVILSLIDSAKLTKAMTALAVGMTELVGVMKMMDQLASNSAQAAKFGVLAASMGLLAGAVLILSGAIVILAQLSWEQLAKGLGAVTAMLTLMVVTAQTMEGNAAGMVAAGLAMIPLATGLVIMAGAVELFGHMSWETMAKGMIGLAGALGIIAAVMNVMPVFSLLAAGIAMIPLATGIGILAGVIKLFATMSWGEMAKGMVALAASLGIIAVAMTAMPITLPITAAGLVLVGVALTIMAGAVKLFGSMDWAAIGKALAAIAGLLIVLAIGVNAMDGALTGAVAMVVVAGALAVLSKVLIELSHLSWGDLAKGLAAIAGVFVVIGLAGLVLTPVVPALIGLGVAMTLVGVGFALFGAGAFMVGKAMEALAAAGKAGTAALIASFNMVLKALPEFIASFVGSLAKSVGNVSGATSLMLKLFTVLLLQILETIIKIAPKIAEAILAIVLAGLVLIRGAFPQVAATAMDMLIVLLTTIEGNMDRITQLALDILLDFVSTLRANMHTLVDAAVDLMISFIGAIAGRMNDITAAGANLILSLLAGLVNNLYQVIDFAVTVLITFAQTIVNEAFRVMYAGSSLIMKLMDGIEANVQRVIDKAVDVVIRFLEAMSSDAIKFADHAAKVLIAFLNGMSKAIDDNAPEIRKAAVKLAEAIVDGITGGLLDTANVGKVIDAAKGLVQKGYQGAKDWLLSKSPSRRFMQLAETMAQGVAVGLDNDTTAQNSAVSHAERIVNAFQETLSRIPDSLAGMDEFAPTITPVLDLSKVQAGARSIGNLIGVSSISPGVSLDQARYISTTAELAGRPAPDPLAEQHPRQVTFNQTINSPTALSTNDIYKGTKSQFARAKEELDI